MGVGKSRFGSDLKLSLRLGNRGQPPVLYPPCNYKDSPINFQMMATTYVADTNRYNVGYIYN